MATPIARLLQTRTRTESPLGLRSPTFTLRVVLGVLFVAACFVVWPLWPWLVLGVWTAAALAPLRVRLTRWTRGRSRASALLCALMLVVVVVPVAALSLTFVSDAVAFGERVLSSTTGKAALLALVTEPSDTAASSSAGPWWTAPHVMSVVSAHGERAWSLATELAGVTASIVLGIFVLVAAAYTWMVEEERIVGWIERNVPAPAPTIRRFGRAFLETGRALFLGFGLTGLAQAVIATGAFVLLGVPRPFALGLFAFFASFVPILGASLVWIPVAVGLAATGHLEKGITMAAIGLLAAGIDYWLRPLAGRWAALEMHGFVLLVSMLGGAAMFGPSGLLLGPIAIRLAIEAASALRDARAAAHA